MRGAVARTRGLCQHPIGTREIQPVPGPQPIAHPVDLAKTWRRRQRDRVEIRQYRASTRRPGVDAVLIRAQTSGAHLPHLVHHALGQAFGRMTVFFDLCGQGAAARHITAPVDYADGFLQHGLTQPIPFHSRVTGGEIFAQQLAVFDI